MKYADCDVRDELRWEWFLKDCPGWLEPFADVPSDAAPPLAMTPVHPEAVGSYGPAAIEWIEQQLGIVLRWWQRLAVVRQLEHREDGTLCWPAVVESASRRVGKSVRLRSMALWRLAHAELFGEPQLAIHTGKDLAIVREIQRGAWRWAESRNWRVVRAIGRESIENGDHRWLARSTDGVYGYDVTLGMVDEGWAVATEVVAEGLEPAALERLSPQIVLTSTAHRRATSLMPARIRDALVVDEDLLLLWSAPDGCELGDEATWRASSAHWSDDRARLLAAKYAKAAAGQQDPEFDDPDPMAGFASQYLNRWLLRDHSRAAGVVPLDLWDALDIGWQAPVNPVLAVDVALDRERTTTVGAAWLLDGAPHLQVLDRRPGTDWVAVRLRELVAGGASRSVVIDGRDTSLHPDITAAGLLVDKASATDRAAACAALYDRALVGALTQGGDAAVAEALPRVGWKGSEGARAFTSSGDISALYAITYALHGLLSTSPSVYEEREPMWL